MILSNSGCGRPFNKLKTLISVPPARWVEIWPYRTEIELPRSNGGVSAYVAKHDETSYRYDLVEFDCHNIKLLKKEKIF